MSNFKRYIAAFATSAFLMGTLPVWGAPNSVKAQLDSTSLEMGRVTRLHLNIVVPENTEGVLLVKPQSLLTEAVEVVDVPEADTTMLGNNLMEIKQDIIIQSFDSGDYVIPEIRYLIGRDTLKSNKLSLKVYPVDVSQMETINPDADIEKGDSKWYDFLPDFLIDYWEWILLALIIIPLATYLIIRFRKKGLAMP